MARYRHKLVLTALWVVLHSCCCNGLVHPISHASTSGRQETVLTTFHFLAHGTLEVEIDQAPTMSTRVLAVYPMETYRKVYFRKPFYDLCAFASTVRIEIGPYPSGKEMLFNFRSLCGGERSI